jgi:hypothetical protein
MNDQLVIAEELAIVHQGPELAVQIQDHDSARQVDEVLRLIDDEGIEILAHGYYNDYGGTNLLVVSEYPGAARAVIQAAGYKCETKPVIWIEAPYRAGLAAVLRQRLRASGVGILYTYSSWTDGQQAILVLRTTHDDRALSILSAALEGLALTPFRLNDLAQQSGAVGKAQ